MGKSMQWNADLNIGIEQIDSQHRILFDLAKDLNNAVNMGANARTVDTLFGVIMNYSFNHFESEESFYTDKQGHLEHCHQHYLLLRELQKYIVDYRNKRRVDVDPGEFLEEWITRHIRDFDMPMLKKSKESDAPPKKVDSLDDFDKGEIDKRKFSRVRFDRVFDEDIYAHLFNANSLENGTGSVVDLSSGGLKIYTDMEIDIEDLVIVSCRMGKNFKMKEKAVVKYGANNFFGVEFVAPDTDTVRFLTDLCRP